MKIIIYLGIVALLLLNGCAKKSRYNPNREEVKIPSNAIYEKRPIPAKHLKEARMINPNVREGDIMWFTPGTKDLLNKVLPKNRVSAAAQLYRSGVIGFVHTTSNQSSQSSQSTKEGFNTLNRKLNQMNRNMANRNYDIPSYNPNRSNYKQSSSSSGYKGNSGAKYQYDSSKYEDNLRYQYDYNAQHRDRMYKDYSGNRESDTSDGQYGTGIYGQ